MQHSTGLKAKLHVQQGAAQHGTCLCLLRLPVMWITNSSMYNSLPVRITSEPCLAWVQGQFGGLSSVGGRGGRYLSAMEVLLWGLGPGREGSALDTACGAGSQERNGLSCPQGMGE